MHRTLYPDKIVAGVCFSEIVSPVAQTGLELWSPASASCTLDLLAYHYHARLGLYFFVKLTSFKYNFVYLCLWLCLCVRAYTCVHACRHMSEIALRSGPSWFLSLGFSLGYGTHQLG